MLERLCYATEFEIEGWKKIVPLINIIQEYSNVPLVSLELKMDHFYAVEPNEKLEDFDGKTIKDSLIYRHFKVEKSNQKLGIYVSHQIPINEKLLDYTSTSTGNHCVVATGIECLNGVDYLVLENTGKSKEENYIRIDSPFFETVSKTIEDTKNRYRNTNPDNEKKVLNKYGFGLAQKKWKKMENMTATSFKNKYGSEWFNVKKDGELKYQMFFVKGSMPIYTLQFTKP